MELQSMFNPRPELICKMVNDLASKHKDDALSIVLGWDVVKMNNPRYEGTYDQPLPLIVIDFR